MHDAIAGPIVRDHPKHFYIGMGLLLMALLFAAFGTRYFGRAFTELPPLRMHVHVHALLFTAWVLLFIVQAGLIRSGQTALHRRLGIAGFVMAAVIVAVGWYTAIEGARNGHNPARAPNALVFMVVPAADIALFAMFVAAGWLARRRRELHMRLMLLAMLGGFAWPIITRLPFAVGRPGAMLGILAALVFIAPLKDLVTKRRIHIVDLCGALVIIASIPARRAIGKTQAWQSFAAWWVG